MDQCFGGRQAPACPFPQLPDATGACVRDSTFASTNQGRWLETSVGFAVAFGIVALFALVRMYRLTRRASRVAAVAPSGSGSSRRGHVSGVDAARGRKVMPKSHRRVPGCCFHLPAYMSKLSTRVHVMVVINSLLMCLLTALDYRSFAGRVPEWVTYQGLTIAAFVMAGAFSSIEFEWMRVLRLPGDEQRRARRVQAAAVYGLLCAYVLVAVSSGAAFLVVPPHVSAYGGQRTTLIAVVALLVAAYAAVHGVLPALYGYRVIRVVRKHRSERQMMVRGQSGINSGGTSASLLGLLAANTAGKRTGTSGLGKRSSVDSGSRRPSGRNSDASASSGEQSYRWGLARGRSGAGDASGLSGAPPRVDTGRAQGGRPSFTRRYSEATEVTQLSHLGLSPHNKPRTPGQVSRDHTVVAVRDTGAPTDSDRGARASGGTPGFAGIGAVATPSTTPSTGHARSATAGGYPARLRDSVTGGLRRGSSRYKPRGSVSTPSASGVHGSRRLSTQSQLRGARHDSMSSTQGRDIARCWCCPCLPDMSFAERKVYVASALLSTVGIATGILGVSYFVVLMLRSGAGCTYRLSNPAWLSFASVLTVIMLVGDLCLLLALLVPSKPRSLGRRSSTTLGTMSRRTSRSSPSSRRGSAQVQRRAGSKVKLPPINASKRWSGPSTQVGDFPSDLLADSKASRGSHPLVLGQVRGSSASASVNGSSGALNSPAAASSVSAGVGAEADSKAGAGEPPSVARLRPALSEDGCAPGVRDSTPVQPIRLGPDAHRRPPPAPVASVGVADPAPMIGSANGLTRVASTSPTSDRGLTSPMSSGVFRASSRTSGGGSRAPSGSGRGAGRRESRASVQSWASRRSSLSGGGTARRGSDGGEVAHMAMPGTPLPSAHDLQQLAAEQA